VINATYTPDFYLTDHDSFVEVKGGWGGSSKTKYRRFIAEYPDVRILLLPWSLNEEFKDE